MVIFWDNESIHKSKTVETFWRKNQSSQNNPVLALAKPSRRLYWMHQVKISFIDKTWKVRISVTATLLIDKEGDRWSLSNLICKIYWKIAKRDTGDPKSVFQVHFPWMIVNIWLIIKSSNHSYTFIKIAEGLFIIHWGFILFWTIWQLHIINNNQIKIKFS